MAIVMVSTCEFADRRGECSGEDNALVDVLVIAHVTGQVHVGGSLDWKAGENGDALGRKVIARSKVAS